MTVATPEETPASSAPARARADSAAYALSAVFAALFFLASLTPSLMPRSPVVQGIIAGAAAAVGWEIGNFVQWLWKYLELPDPKVRWQQISRVPLLAVAAAVGLYALWRATDWQNATRRVMSLEPITSSDPVTIVVVAAVAFLLVWGIVKILQIALRWILRPLMYFLPRRVSLVLGFIIVAWVSWAFAEGVVGSAIIRAADASFEVVDSFVDPELPVPLSPAKTGSAESLVGWQEMGRWGREFVALAPTRDEIAKFAGPSAMEPVRVYVGLRAADGPRARAELALEELKRVGGFDRSYLVVVNSTGSGWMDPGAQDTLDYMLGGDVATVVAQYSYLPSALALFANADVGIEQGRVLFEVIYNYWTTLPKDSRPKLYVHGLSLGAFNLQAALPLLDLLGDPIDGALWVGSPFFSRVWDRVRDSRKPGSPAWRPVYGNGSLVRVLNQEGYAPGAMPWGPTRLVFLTYGSDPIAAFAFADTYRAPEWTYDPRAFDVARELRWFPIVTMLQIALDTVFSLKVPAYGHYYVAEHYIDGWGELLDPPGWNQQEADELKAIFAERPLPM